MAPPPLKPNPVGCDGFEKNPFKGEYCKKCGKSFLEHEGVIEDAGLSEATRLYEARMRKEEEKKSAKATLEQKKSFEARLEKMKEEKAKEQEDDWFFEETQTAKPSTLLASMGSNVSTGSPDDFKMISAEELKKANEAQKAAQAKPVQIKNLIDFDEAEEEAKEHLAASRSLPSLHGGSPAREKSSPSSPAVPQSHTLPAQSAAPSKEKFDISKDFGARPGGGGETVDELKAELQMLQEERSIQIAILKDEYEATIDSLRQKLQVGGSMPSKPSREQDLEAELEAKAQAATVAQTRVTELTQELATLREQQEKGTSESESVATTLQVQITELSGERDALRAETEKLRSEALAAAEGAKEARASTSKAEADVLALRSELREQKEKVDSAEREARNSVQEKDTAAQDLRNKIQSLEAQIAAGRAEEQSQLAEMQKRVLDTEKQLAEAEKARDANLHEADGVRDDFAQYKGEEQKRMDAYGEKVRAENEVAVTELQAAHEAAAKSQEQRHVAERTSMREDHLRELEEKAAQMKQDADAQSAALAEEKDAVINELRADLSKVEAEVVAQKETMERKDAELVELPDLRTTMDKQKEIAEELLKQLTDQKEAAKTLEREKAEVEQKLAAKQTALDMQGETVQDLQQKLLAAEGALSNMTKELDQQEHHLEEIHARDKEKLGKKAADLEEKLHALVTDASKLGAQNTAFQREVDDLKAQLDAANAEKNHLAEGHAADRARLQEEVLEATDRAVELSKGLAPETLKAQEALKKAEQEVVDLRAQVSRLHSQDAAFKEAKMQNDMLLQARSVGGDLGKEVVDRYLGEQRTIYTKMLEQKDAIIAKYQARAQTGSASPLATRNRPPNELLNGADISPEDSKSGSKRRADMQPPSVVSVPPGGAEESKGETKEGSDPLGGSKSASGEGGASDKEMAALRSEIIRLRDQMARQRIEQKKLVEEAGRKAAQQAAKAFRDVRLNAEKQFGWLFARVPGEVNS
ncbi:unnamed protein product [Amoebophrya sp. A25]|nr:unnamed protein product [Amoebophrya sp. A25]|eukprot:GSA25T00024699001.1